jgi:hypothetical protein
MRGIKRAVGISAALALGLAGQSGPFGLSLSPGTQALLAQVEKAFHHPIIERALDDGQLLGSSYVNADGFPVVSLSPTGRNEPTLAHELMHMLLKAEGYADVLHLMPDGSAPTGIAQRELTSALLLIRDPIEHWIFAPRLRTLGLNPDQYNVERMRGFLKDGKFRGLAPATEDSMRAVFYYEAVLVLEHDPELLRQVRDRYGENGWLKERELGESMADVVLQTKPSTPEEEISRYVACCNLIFAGKVHFAAARWETTEKGSFKQRIVYIATSAPTSVQ